MKAIKCAGLIGVLLLPGAVQALDWSQDWSDWEIRPRAGTGFMQYKYDQAPQALLIRDEAFIEGGGQEGLKAEDTLLFAELGVSAFFGNFFVDVSFQKSDEGDDSVSFDSAQAVVEDTNAITFIATDQSGDVEIDRQEFSLSAGYALTEFLGVFAGYKKNETNLDQSLSGELFLAQEGASVTVDVVTSVNSEFEQDGFFVGATYVWPFETDGWLNGALSFDLGVAFLDGDFSTKGARTATVAIIDETETIDINSSASGSAVGLNLGIAWTGPIFDRLNYSVGVDGYQYDYDGDGDSADFEDTLVRFSVGISYAVDANLFR